MDCPFSTKRIPSNEDMRPLLGLSDKPGTQRVPQYVICLFMGRFLAPEPMVEKIPLPCESARAASPSLEICNRSPHRMCRIWKTEQRVRVVRHQKKDPTIPCPGLMPVAHGVEDRVGVKRDDIRSARLRAERNKKCFLFDGNSNRCVVGKLLSPDIHATDNSKTHPM